VGEDTEDVVHWQASLTTMLVRQQASNQAVGAVAVKSLRSTSKNFAETEKYGI
jgi:hypothetical protein